MAPDARGSAMTRPVLLVASLILATLSVALPAEAVCTSPDFILEGGSCGGGGGGGCSTVYEEGSSGMDSAHRTTCSDGFSCTANHHHNDPNQPSSTTYDPPGCNEDPRY